MDWLGDLVDAILPRTDKAQAVDGISHDMVRDLYRPHQVNAFHILSHYRRPEVRTLIHATKFSNHDTAAEKLALLLHLWLTSQSTPYLVIPIPLSTSRLLERGYNQVTRIVRHAIIQTPHHIETDLLVRCKDTAPQTSLPRSERLHNVTDAFTTTLTGADLKYQHILLIDDVTTTGATLHSAKRVLEDHSPASITCIAIAG